MAAIERVTADPSLHTGDLGGTATTAQVTDAVCAILAGGLSASAAAVAGVKAA
jgi:tartrate dehydrogenase/decarboxylase/D-malate dehydrogenase